MVPVHDHQQSLTTSILTLRKSSQHRLITDNKHNKTFVLNIISGSVRLYCVNDQEITEGESTLALMNAETTSHFSWRNHRQLMLEALETAKVEFNPSAHAEGATGFLDDWILDLYEVKQPADSLERLVKLLLLLAKRLNPGTDFSQSATISGLSHRRIGEMISSTRPTVSRHLGWLQRHELISVDALTRTIQLDAPRLRARQEEMFGQPRPHLH